MSRKKQDFFSMPKGVVEIRFLESATTTLPVELHPVQAPRCVLCDMGVPFVSDRPSRVP